MESQLSDTLVLSISLNGSPRRSRTVRSLLSLALAAPLLLGACVSLKAPERINIGNGGGRAQRVDADHVPPIPTVAEGRVELDKAYRYIRDLERLNESLERDNEKLKRERDDAKHRRGD